jgi:hypothetical protein
MSNVTKIIYIAIFGTIVISLIAVVASQRKELAPIEPVEFPEIIDVEPLGADVEPTRFAHVTPEGIIDNIIVADQAFIDSGIVGDPASWVPTDYKVKDSAAEIGGSYDWQKGKFIDKVETKEKKSSEENTPPETATST